MENTSKMSKDLVKQWLEWLFEEDSEKPIGPCLSDEEIWDYIEEEIDNEEEKARIEAHILSCPKCLETACRCAEIDHYLNTRKGKKEMKRIGRKLRRIQMELYPDLYLRRKIGRYVISALARMLHAFRNFFTVIQHLGEIPFPLPALVRGGEGVHHALKAHQLKKWGYMSEYEVFVLPGENGYIRLRFFRDPAAPRRFELSVELYMGRIRIRKEKTQRISPNESWVFFDDLLITDSNWKAFSYRISPVKR